MPVNLIVTPHDQLVPIQGLRIGIAEAGIRKANRKDLTVMLLDEGCAVGAVFTQNRYCAAPVQICRDHLQKTRHPRAILVNTGCANAGTGDEGMSRALASCIALAQHLDIAPEEVLPFSTGVIMEQLPLDRLRDGIPAALAAARSDGQAWGLAAQAIMTTDTLPKARSAQVVIGGHTVSITGISKGAGMIRPNMATMLGFMATDACIAPELMPELAKRLADASFNRITVDGDTSTNDSFVVIATQRAGHPQINSLDSADGQSLLAAMQGVAQALAHAIVRDGEGATKFIEVRIEGARSSEEALQAAYAVAHSPLVKTAFFASDPNLGRILAAVGYSGIDDLDASKIGMWIGDVEVVRHGGRLASYQEAEAAAVMAQSDITIRVNLGRGNATETVWTCDFSYDYVKINADYRS